MKYRSIIYFGLVSGILWATVPLVLSEITSSPAEIFSVYTAGAITGVFVSIVLGIIFPMKGFWKVLLVGILSLPIGAFVFGFIISLEHGIIYRIYGEKFRFIKYGFDPIELGLQYAVLSVVTIFSIALIPLAIITTFSLNCYIRKVQPVGGADSTR